MKAKLPRSKFESAARRRLNSGTPPEAIASMVDEYDVTEQEITAFLRLNSYNQAISKAITGSREEREKIYNTLDKKFIDKYKLLVVFMRGENITFYEYRKGVYVALHDIEMENLVDELMEELGLLDYRTKRKFVKDTVSRIASILCRTKGRKFVDEEIYNDKFYINLKNGLLDPTTYILSEHTPSYFSTVQVPFNYDPQATAPEFEAFVTKVSDNKDSTKQMIQEMFGYGISDGNKKHKVFYLYGNTARNGKSTTAKLLCGLIGMGNISTLSLSQMAGETSTMLTSIINKQINFSDELSSKYIDSSRLTAMSSEGMIEINPKYKQAFMYRVKAKFIVACNDLPKFHDAQGMKHRMISIPFRVQIPQSERINRYDEILLEKEGSGILNWAIEGAKLLEKDGVFTVNEESKEDIMDNLYGSNSVYAFIDQMYDFSDEYTELVKTEDMYGDVGVKDSIPTMYRLFCLRTGIKPVALQTFKIEVGRFCDETGKIGRRRVNNERFYTGLQDKDYKTKNF